MKKVGSVWKAQCCVVDVSAEDLGGWSLCVQSVLLCFIQLTGFCASELYKATTGVLWLFFEGVDSRILRKYEFKMIF